MAVIFIFVFPPPFPFWSNSSFKILLKHSWFYILLHIGGWRFHPRLGLNIQGRTAPPWGQGEFGSRLLQSLQDHCIVRERAEMEGSVQLPLGLGNNTSYIIGRAWCRMKMWGPLFKINQNFTTAIVECLNQACDPLSYGGSVWLQTLPVREAGSA